MTEDKKPKSFGTVKITKSANFEKIRSSATTSREASTNSTSNTQRTPNKAKK